MFFRKSGSPPNPAASTSSSPALHLVKDDAATAIGSSTHGNGAHDASSDLGLVLDALGNILATYARYTFDLPDRSAEESTTELTRWQRHATLGVPLTTDAGATALGVHPRDWTGVVRSFASQRRDEKQYVDTAMGDLREALWACIQTVHNAVRTDVATDMTVAVQMQRAHSAIDSMQLGTIKDEVLGAITTIGNALATKRSAQEAQYKSLAEHLDTLRDELAEARRDSTTDALTGLGNRKLFDVSLARTIEFNTLSRTPVSLLMIDVDSLKKINDTYGHQGGDHAIVTVSNCLSKVFLRQTDTLCRFGGDEFAAILHNTDEAMATTLAKRLVGLVGDQAMPVGMDQTIGVSVGLAEIGPLDDAASWVARADQALYEAKQQGRARVVVAPRSTASTTTE